MFCAIRFFAPCPLCCGAGHQQRTPFLGIEFCQSLLQWRNDLVGLNVTPDLGTTTATRPRQNLVGHADNCGFVHTFQVINFGFDLFGINVVAARNDQILGPADDGDVTILIKLGDVTRDKNPSSRKAVFQACANILGTRLARAPLGFQFRPWAIRRLFLDRRHAIQYWAGKSNCARTPFPVIGV